MRSFLHFIIIGCIFLGLLLIAFDFCKSTIYNKVIVPKLNHPTFSVDVQAAKYFTNIIDARTKEEFKTSHLKEAKLRENMNAFVKKDSILVYCTVGKRSSDFVNELRDSGFENVFNLKGGIISYANQGLNTYRNLDSPSDSIHTYNILWSLFLNEGKVAVY